MSGLRGAALRAGLWGALLGVVTPPPGAHAEPRASEHVEAAGASPSAPDDTAGWGDPAPDPVKPGDELGWGEATTPVGA